MLLASWSRQVLWSLLIESKRTLALTYGPQLSQPSQLGQVASAGGESINPMLVKAKADCTGIAQMEASLSSLEVPKFQFRDPV